jgi:hypothetical protein
MDTTLAQMINHIFEIEIENAQLKMRLEEIGQINPIDVPIQLKPSEKPEVPRVEAPAKGGK